MPFFKTYLSLEDKDQLFFKHDLVKKHLQKTMDQQPRFENTFIPQVCCIEKKPIMSYTREVLSKRHRLSHQQIDHWLGKIAARNFTGKVKPSENAGIS
jgi:hypothetical protein